MFKKFSITQKALFAVLVFYLVLYLTLVFYISYSLKQSGTGTAAFITLFSAALIFLCCLAVKKEGLWEKTSGLIYICIPISAAFLLRLCLFDVETLDYINFLSVWIDKIEHNGGLKALKEPIGNYNVPYLFFLAVISYFPISKLYLIKLLSVLFDFVLAFYLMRLVSLYSESKTRKRICFVAVLFLPTVLLNGALWGQCDSIYAAFAIMSFYYGIKNRPVLSVVCIALSFSLKLQAVFIMPVFLLLILAKRLKIKHLLIFPAVYFAAVSPAIIAGRPIVDTLSIYFSELGTVGSGLNYNSPSIYSLVKSPQSPELLSKLGVFAAFALCGFLFVFCYINRQKITDRTLLSAALIFSLGIPLLLPHMHDRYFFIADTLTLAFAVISPTYLFTAPLTSFASLLGYHAYLKMRYLLPMRYGFYALFIVSISVSIFFVKSFSSDAGTAAKASVHRQ